MQFDPVLPEERIRSMRLAGFWRDRLLTDYLDEAVAAAPDRTAIIAHNSMTGARTILTYRELAEQVDRLALGLAGLGVRRDDVVSFQLPTGGNSRRSISPACASAPSPMP